MPKLYISYDARREAIEDTRGCDGPYTGHCETETDLTVNYLCKESVETFGSDIEVTDEVFNLQKAYFVVVRYSTGDTFSRNRGEYSFIAVFPSFKEANILKKEIEMWAEGYEDNKHGKYSFAPSIKNPAYEKELNCPWHGYFESLDHVEIHALSIEDGEIK